MPFNVSPLCTGYVAPATPEKERAKINDRTTIFVNFLMVFHLLVIDWYIFLSLGTKLFGKVYYVTHKNYVGKRFQYFFKKSDIYECS
jgi:hypothetical protein